MNPLSMRKDTKSSNEDSDREGTEESQIEEYLNKLYPKVVVEGKNNSYEDSLKEKRQPVEGVVDPYNFSVDYQPWHLHHIQDFCERINELKTPVMNKVKKYKDFSVSICLVCKNKMKDLHLCKFCLKPFCDDCLKSIFSNINPYVGIKCPLCKTELNLNEYIIPFGSSNKKECYSLPLESVFDVINVDYLYFCKDCNNLLLPFSIVKSEEHKGHCLIKMKEYYKYLKQIYSDRKNKMFYIYSDLSSKIFSLEYSLKELENEKIKREEELKAFYESSLKKLRTKYESIRNKIENEKLKLIELSSLIKKDLNNLDKKSR